LRKKLTKHCMFAWMLSQWRLCRLWSSQSLVSLLDGSLQLQLHGRVTLS